MQNLVVDATESLTERIKQITLKSADGSPLPSYSAGAHLEFELPGYGTRAYSLIDFSAPPAQPLHYRIAVQREDDGRGGSQLMHRLNSGDTLSASDPRNNFELAADDLTPMQDAGKPVLLLAGGIGITPLISMAATLKARQSHFHLHYSGRKLGAMAYSAQLQQLLPSQISVYTDDDEQHRLDLQQLLSGIEPGQSIYVCGPRPMIDQVRTLAEAAGLAQQDIHFELFESAADNSGDSAFEVELQNSGEVYTVPPGKSIIEVLEAAGVDLVYDCQRGDCGICQTGVSAGEIDHRDVVLSEAERASGTVMQICVSRARSARLVLDLP